MPSKTTTTAGASPAAARPRWTATLQWPATAARLLLAVVWIWAGGSKVADPAASVRAVRAYRLLPEWLAKAVGYGLPFLEIAIGLLLLVGLATRLAAAVSAALLVVFLAGIISASARGLQIECGCFGGGGNLAAGQGTSYTLEILRDIGLLLVSGFLVAWPRSRLSVDEVVQRGAGSDLDAARVGPRRTRAAQNRMAELVERRRQEGERRLRLASALCAVALVVVAGIGIGIQSARVGSPAGPQPQAVSLGTGVVVGRADARVTVDLYEDFQCPVCKQFEQESGPTLTELMNAGTVKLHYHVIAILNRASTTLYSSRAANAGYCAADAGVFERYHNLLFANQPPEGSSGLPDDTLIALGRQAGATSETFASCVRDRRYNDFVNRVTEQASKDGVVGTPTVLIDNVPQTKLDPDSIRTAVTDALQH